MSWTLGGIRIFVQKFSEGVESIIAKLQPLQAGTVYQSFGYETNKVKFSGLVVGSGDLYGLKNMTESGGTTFPFYSYEGFIGDYFVESVSADREKTYYQSIRPDLDCTTPVYTVDIELLEDV
jgi:hypothetical protein